MRWTEAGYEILYGDHPPTEPMPPNPRECDEIGRRLGCSQGAVAAQWDDGRALVLGQTNAASRRLADYVKRRGWV